MEGEAVVVEDGAEEVVEETSEEIVLDEEQEIEQEEETESEDIFDPDEMEFDEDNVIAGYDLSKFKDKFDLDDPEIIAQAEELQKLGFTQEQMEYFAEKQLVKPEEPKRTKQDIQNELKEKLTTQEKRNYKSVVNFVKSSLEGTEYEKYANDISTNPNLIKLFNQMYMKSQGKSPTKTKRQKGEVRGKKITPEQARKEYMDEYIGKAEVKSAEARKEFLNSLIARSNNKAELEKEFKDLL